jgi:hypothetical protein
VLHRRLPFQLVGISVSNVLRVLDVLSGLRGRPNVEYREDRRLLRHLAIMPGLPSRIIRYALTRPGIAQNRKPYRTTVISTTPMTTGELNQPTPVGTPPDRYSPGRIGMLRLGIPVERKGGHFVETGVPSFVPSS